jgi:hypothetical protein
MPTPPSIWFRLVSLVAAAFVLTVLVLIAAFFTDPNTPLNQWLNRYALIVLLVEVGLLLILGFFAMLHDRPTKLESKTDEELGE